MLRTLRNKIGTASRSAWAYQQINDSQEALLPAAPQHDKESDPPELREHRSRPSSRQSCGPTGQDLQAKQQEAQDAETSQPDARGHAEPDRPSRSGDQLKPGARSRHRALTTHTVLRDIRPAHRGPVQPPRDPHRRRHRSTNVSARDTTSRAHRSKAGLPPGSRGTSTRCPQLRRRDQDLPTGIALPSLHGHDLHHRSQANRRAHTMARRHHVRDHQRQGEDSACRSAHEGNDPRIWRIGRLSIELAREQVWILLRFVMDFGYDEGRYPCQAPLLKGFSIIVEDNGWNSWAPIFLYPHTYLWYNTLIHQCHFTPTYFDIFAAIVNVTW